MGASDLLFRPWDLPGPASPAVECSPGALLSRGLSRRQPGSGLQGCDRTVNASFATDQLALCREERHACWRVRRHPSRRHPRRHASLRGNGSGECVHFAGNALRRQLSAVGLYEARCPQFGSSTQISTCGIGSCCCFPLRLLPSLRPERQHQPRHHRPGPADQHHTAGRFGPGVCLGHRCIQDRCCSLPPVDA